MKKDNTRSNNFGSKLKKLRTEKGLSYEDLANDTGYTPQYLKDIESQKIIPPVSAIIQISKALSIDAGTFLTAEEQKESEKRRISSYLKRTEEYAYTPLTPGAKTKHMKAFLVVIPPLKEHKKVEYQHEGEEFIYVLAGKLEITIGDNVRLLNSNESIHFNSAIVHKLRNPGHEETKLIVVVYTP